MSFDLLDRPLVYIPVKWPGVVAGPDGEAVATEHSVEIQVEILDDAEVEEWSNTGSRDPHAAERASLTERINANDQLLEIGVAGAGEKAVALQAENDALRAKDRPAIAARDLASFRTVAKGWRGIKANGRLPDFNDTNISALLARQGFGAAFGAAYIAAWRGQVAIREKNSDGSPANGPAVEPTEKTAKAETLKS